MLIDTEAAWLAGILEGEGCFTTARMNHHRHGRPLIALAMTDRDVVQRVADLAGVSMQCVNSPAMQTLGRKPRYSIKVLGTRAINLMKEVRPYMGDRRGAKIDELLETYKDFGARVGIRSAETGRFIS